MIVTPEIDRANYRASATVGFLIALLSVVLCTVHSFWWLLGLLVAAIVFWYLRRTSRRRLQVISKPFPEVWEMTLQQYVSFYVALDTKGRKRFQDLVKVFLDDVDITGVRTEVDEPTRALVAASAVIPIFGFDWWEYSRLGEILIYPDSFNEDYDSARAAGGNILGMIGTGHLSGVMILSKPSLIAGFQNDGDKRNVGIHEFAHLVDKEDGSVDGIPATIPAGTIDPWVRWVGEELRGDGAPAKSHIDDYAYTNEAEYFAVLSEYFFERPAILEQKNPKLYAMMEKIYRQSPKRLFHGAPRRRGRVRRNDPCPCGSGEKFKRCCRRKRMRGVPT